MQQAWRRLTADEVGVDVTEAVAERVDMIGALDGADTMVTVVVDEAAGTVAGLSIALFFCSSTVTWDVSNFSQII